MLTDHNMFLIYFFSCQTDAQDLLITQNPLLLILYLVIYVPLKHFELIKLSEVESRGYCPFVQLAIQLWFRMCLA